MQDSIFTKIIKGEIPCYKIYEDAKTFAFLDIEPYFPGHTLVVPKLQIDKFDDLPDEDYQALFDTVRKVTKQLKGKLGTERAIVQIFGFDVPHVHVHIMPTDNSEQFYQAAASHISGKPYPYQPTPEELTAIAKKVRMEDEL
ncbi:MAG TPA: HIT domain-containing protein [Candidatus Saccharimonadia bacterium]|nr:HIT domain-containing protein [Candidatus Saccharimonadia bacterium]